MKRKRLEPEWISYRSEVIPKAADEIQVEECRRAFYAGAAAIHDVILHMLDPGAEPTDADLEKMTDLHAELKAFLSSI